MQQHGKNLGHRNCVLNSFQFLPSHYFTIQQSTVWVMEKGIFEILMELWVFGDVLFYSMGF